MIKKTVKIELNQCKFSKESTDDNIKRYKIFKISSKDIKLNNEN